MPEDTYCVLIIANCYSRNTIHASRFTKYASHHECQRIEHTSDARFTIPHSRWHSYDTAFTNWTSHDNTATRASSTHTMFKWTTHLSHSSPRFHAIQRTIAHRVMFHGLLACSTDRHNAPHAHILLFMRTTWGFRWLIYAGNLPIGRAKKPRGRGQIPQLEPARVIDPTNFFQKNQPD